MTESDYDNGNGNGDPDSYADDSDNLGLYEATRRVNVRQAPSLDAPIVRVLQPGDQVPVAAIEAGWAQLDSESAELVKIDYLERS